jgi:uncharacterized protein (DUF2267 family)
MMTQTGLDTFDRTLQQTHLWLNDVGKSEAVGPDTQRQFHALRSVLWALRDRLTVDEAFDLSSNLPLLIRGIYWENYRPSGKPENFRTRAEFLKKVEDALEGAIHMNPEGAARAVLGMIAARVPKGQVEDIKRMVPEEIRTLFPQD